VTRAASFGVHDSGRWLRWLTAIALALGFLFLAFSVLMAGHPFWALGVLVFAAAGFTIYLTQRGFAWRYLFPGVAGMLLFVAFPLVYTMQIGFTNYSSNNLLAEDRARAYLLEQSAPDEAKTLGFTLHPDGDEYRVVLRPLHEPGNSPIRRGVRRSRQARWCRRRWPCARRSRPRPRRCCRRTAPASRSTSRSA
jgi:hypothetical protein